MDNGYESINIHLNEELSVTQNENCHFSSYKFYITTLILIIFIMTFNIVNKDKIKNELKEEMKDELKINFESNFLSNVKRYIKKDALKTKIGLCVIGKKENKYAKEYVDYYKSIGFSHIFIYDNNDKDDERFEEVLSEDISKILWVLLILEVKKWSKIWCIYWLLWEKFKKLCLVSILWFRWIFIFKKS